MQKLSATPLHLPNGPKGRLLVGNLPQFSRDPLKFITDCVRQYGDVVRIHIGPRLSYMINHPDHIEYVLVTNNRNFIKDLSVRLPPFRWLLGQGLLTSSGDFWLRQRRLAQPAFHRHRIAAYAETMAVYAEKMAASWRDGETRDAHQEMMRLTLDIVSKTLFDADVGGHANDVGAALEVVMDRLSSQGSLIRALDQYLPTPGTIRFRRATRRLDEIIYGIIRQRRASGQDTGDLLSMLLHAQDEDGSRMTDRQLRDEAMTLFLAGHETTALALSWTWYLLSLHPDVEERLAEELRAALGGRRPGMEDLPNLPFADKIIKEAMRLFPPAWSIGREALQDCEIGGYHVPAGTQVYMMQWTMHRDPRYFDNPEAFDPDRWTDEFIRQLPKYAYFPFGGGPRLCIGNSFAMMEAVLILATVAQKVRLTLAPNQTVTPWPSVTLRPRDGIRMVVSRR
ncbi:MAG TPA: cytochrome P450 [Blastocatellia bacterium]|nr:cytochrome P450 [Blastocatellia bacterium]